MEELAEDRGALSVIDPVAHSNDSAQDKDLSADGVLGRVYWRREYENALASKSGLYTCKGTSSGPIVRLICTTTTEVLASASYKQTYHVKIIQDV